ncbi:MAG TPA: MBL fold metallo-hydrolase [Solirubrobacteraceae bacterium]|nr:MBL fold metallo-hydrolase [Solirubrobacteraceae bacterium]
MSDPLQRSHAGRAGDELAVTWLGHSTVLLELDGSRLLTDPVLGARAGPLVRIAPPISEADYEAVDAVLLSHLHGDHADGRSLRWVGRETRVIAPAGARRWLALRGLRNVQELSLGEWTRVGEVAISLTPAVHGGVLHRAARVAPSGFIATGSQTCYFAGDTDLFAGMRTLSGVVDLALLPIGGWGPRLGAGHLDPASAATAAALIAPRVAVPIHWGTLVRAFSAQRGADRGAPARLFAELARRQAPQVQVHVLAPGERLALAPGARPGRIGDARA